MELYVLRHAIAAPRGTKGYQQDSDRPLTDDGIAKLRDAVRGMRALDLTFDLILTSSYLRAQQTAEIVAKEMRVARALKPCPHLTPGGDSKALIAEINASGTARILLVGHEPDLSRLISILTSGDDRTAITLKKGGLCKLAADTLRHGRCASLEWLLAPGQLRRVR